MNSYIFHFNLYDLGFLGAIFIGLTFALLLWFTKTINRGANRFLALALVTTIVWMMRVLVIDIRLDTYLPMQFLLALGPLMYFYVLKITCPQYKFSRRDLFHFSPLLLEQAAFVLEISESDATGTATYATHAFKTWNPVIQVLIFISNITYLYLCDKRIQQFYRGLQPLLMDRPLIEFRWLRRLLAATVMLWLLWLVCAAVNYVGYRNQSGIQVYYPFYIFFAIIIIWTAAAAFLKPQAAVAAQAAAPYKSAVSAEVRAKGTLLKRAMEVNRHYQKPELNLSSLAEKVSIPPHELSRIINTVFKKGFNDFINEYRVRDVVLKMQDPAYDNITLQGIAFEAGFNSKATFIRAFKQLTGKTPAEYKNELEKQVAIYHLQPRPHRAAIISGKASVNMGPHKKLNCNYMLRNYFKIAIRNLARNKAFSLINIMGLALGLACSLLIMLWVHDEYDIDAFHKNGARLYSIYERQNHDGQWNAFYATPAVMADEMKRVLHEVEYAANYSWNEMATFEANNKIIKESGNYAGADFFNMFSYHVLEGNAANALQTPSGITISKKMAEDFFGSPAAAIGKTIRYQARSDFKITAVFDNVPGNSTQQFEYILNWHEFLRRFVNDPGGEWANSGPACYIMLRKGTDAKAFEKRINRFLDTYNKQQTSRDYTRLGIQRYGDIYLHSGFDKNANISGGRIEYVQLFSIVAIFILLIACINFMNLTTARSIKRAKEIGVRKVIGAVRASLVSQFIGEAMLVVLLSVTVALVVVIFVLPAFNQLTAKHITIPFYSAAFWVGIAALFLITGFISGSYPALYLSSFNPVHVLKGRLKFSRGALWFRKGLVVFQFVLSVILIVGTMVISKQVGYIRSANLGYNRENLIYVPLEGELAGKFNVFKIQALNMPGIQNITCMSQNLTQIVPKTSGVDWEGKEPNSAVEFTWSKVGYDFTKTLHAQIAEGRDFSKKFASDSAGYILNETGAKITGYKNPVGRPFTFRQKRGIIIGVVKDFHFSSLHETINPLVLSLGENTAEGAVLVRTEPGRTKEALASLDKIYKEINPQFPFTYQFSDEEYTKLYRNEQVAGKLSNYFAFLAIFIACLGLLGLVIFTAEQRTKEFGIRKVLGASPVSLIALLAKEFLVLVFIAMLIASPLAWLAMHNWLNDYAYKITMSWWMFGAAGGATIVIALITISFQAIKAAMANPVKNLRSE